MLSGTCQKPGCGKDAENTYADENANTLSLCDKHYYELVSGESTILTPQLTFTDSSSANKYYQRDFDTTTQTVDWPPEQE